MESRRRYQPHPIPSLKREEARIDEKNRMGQEDFMTSTAATTTTTIDSEEMSGATSNSVRKTEGQAGNQSGQGSEVVCTG